MPQKKTTPYECKFMGKDEDGLTYSGKMILESETLDTAKSSARAVVETIVPKGVTVHVAIKRQSLLSKLAHWWSEE